MQLEYPIRINSFLAKSGCGSRRFCETLVQEGRVTVNMQRVSDLATRIQEDDIVMVDGETVQPVERAFYYALHKPRGYLSTNYDPNETLYARELIDTPAQHLLFHVGRLDRDSSGLILYSNDGDFAQAITHPSMEVEKEYMVRTKSRVERSHMEEALKGVIIDGVRYTIRRFELYSRTWTRIILTEGKNRQIRRIFEHYGYEISELVRTRIGCIELDTLKVGHYRTLRKSEIDALLRGETEPIRPRRDGRW